MPCAIFVGSRRYSGMVLDISANGLFVQTSANPETGDAVRVECHPKGQAEPVELQASVARRKVVPAQLRTVAQGGLGLRVESAPEAYYQYVAEILREQIAEPVKPAPKAKPPAAPRRPGPSRLERKARQIALRQALGPRRPAEPQHAFRVRVGRGTRSRILTVLAGGEDEACARAIEKAGGEGWMVLKCERKAG